MYSFDRPVNMCYLLFFIFMLPITPSQPYTLHAPLAINTTRMKKQPAAKEQS